MIRTAYRSRASLPERLRFFQVGEKIGGSLNSGATIFRDDYGPLCKQLDFGGAGEAGLEGPKLADCRIAQVTNALKVSNVEVTVLSTALTQEQWAASEKLDGVRVDRSA